MKFLGRQGDALEFELSAREARALRFVLGRYPALDPEYHQLVRPGEGVALVEEQRLLVEEMTAAQRENRSRLESFFANRLPATDGTAPDRAGTQLRLTEAEADWLLEVLNDVRLGAWVRLGRPTPDRTELPKSDAPALADFSAMEVAGLVQMVLLEALEA